MSAKLLALKERIDHMRPADQLLLAAELLRRGEKSTNDLAISIAEKVVCEYQAARLFRTEPRP